MQQPPGVFDACVVGCGPSGITVALELSARGLSVALVESGGGRFDRRTQSLSEADIVSPSTHSPMSQTVRRGLGGTSALWGGRCVPFDPVDFVPRDYVRDSGWPIGGPDLNDYYEAACAYATCGAPSFHVQSCDALETISQSLTPLFRDGEVRQSTLERWSKEPNFWTEHGAQIRKDPRIQVFKQCTCTGFEHPGPDAPVSAAVIRSSSTPKEGATRVAAKTFIVACGGIESTRLLLNSRLEPDGLKLPADVPLGRYYVGHASGKIASVRLVGPPEQTIYGFERDGDVYVRRRLTFTEDALHHHRLMNIAFWLDNPPLHDPSHGNGFLSAAYLALRTPIVGKVLAPEAIRKKLVEGHSPQLSRHLANCVLGAHKTIWSSLAFLYRRYVKKPRLPGFFTYNPSNHYALHYHAEQAPNPDSRIELSEARDATGLRRARIDLRYSQADVDSIVRAHQLLDEYLQSNGIGELEYWYPPSEIEKAVEEQMTDGFHQMGTTRMADSPDKGVTDSFGRVFGTTNLFVASSSVFPTSGQANCTLPLLAFAIRQAHHIAEQLHAEGTRVNLGR